MTFINLDYKACKYSQITWIDPKTKQAMKGDVMPSMIIEDYIKNHQDIIKKYTIKVIEI